MELRINYNLPQVHLRNGGSWGYFRMRRDPKLSGILRKIRLFLHWKKSFILTEIFLNLLRRHLPLKRSGKMLLTRRNMLISRCIIRYEQKLARFKRFSSQERIEEYFCLNPVVFFQYNRKHPPQTVDNNSRFYSTAGQLDCK